MKLYFVRSGYVYPNGKYLSITGAGYYWSSSPASNTNYAYDLDFNASGVYPSSYLSRYYGFPLRCLAR